MCAPAPCMPAPVACSLLMRLPPQGGSSFTPTPRAPAASMRIPNCLQEVHLSTQGGTPHDPARAPVVVHAQHAVAAAPAVVRARRLGGGALFAEPVQAAESEGSGVEGCCSTVGRSCCCSLARVSCAELAASCKTCDSRSRAAARVCGAAGPCRQAQSQHPGSCRRASHQQAAASGGDAAAGSGAACACAHPSRSTHLLPPPLRLTCSTATCCCSASGCHPAGTRPAQDEGSEGAARYGAPWQQQECNSGGCLPAPARLVTWHLHGTLSPLSAALSRSHDQTVPAGLPTLLQHPPGSQNTHSRYAAMASAVSAVSTAAWPTPCTE